MSVPHRSGSAPVTVVPERARGAGDLPGWRLGVVDALLVVGLGVAATWPLAAAYDGSAWLVAAATGLGLGVAVGWLSAWLRWGPLLTALAAVAGYLVVGSAVALPANRRHGALPTADSLHDLVVGIVRCWRESLTLPAPLGESGVVLLVPLLTGLTGALAAVVLLWRSRRPGLAGVVIGLVLLLSSAFGDVAAQAVLGRGLLIAAVGVTWLRWRSQRHVQARWLRRAVATFAVVGVAAVAASGLASLAAPANRVVLRDHVDPPFDPRDYPSPLSKFRAYKKPELLRDTTLFTVEGLESGTPVRLAVMDAYDGIVWNVAGGGGAGHDSGTFRRFRSAPDANLRGNAHGQITVGAYTGVWVPSVGDTLGMTPMVDGRTDDGAASELVINRQTGTVAEIGGVAPGTTFQIDADVPLPLQDEEIARLKAARVDLPSPAIVPEELKDRVQRWQVELDFSGGTSGELAEFLRDAFREKGFYSDGIDDDVPGGHGASRMAMLTKTATPVGDAEQYASAMALVGQQMGLPIRVVIGFKVPPGGGPVRGEQITAWTEVRFAGVGWVPFDPTPPENQKLRRPNDDPDEKPQPQVLQPPRVPGEPKEATDNLQQGDGKRSRVDLLEVLGTILAVALAVGKVVALTSPLWGVLLFKTLRRRRRRRAADDAGRLVGAWREFADRVRDLGVRPSPGATRRELAYAAAERYDAVPLAALASTADRHVFGPGAPTEEDARAYWADVETALKRMRKATPWWRRILARFSLASVPWREGGEVLRSRLEHLGRRLLASRPVRAVRRRVARAAARLRRR